MNCMNFIYNFILFYLVTALKIHITAEMNDELTNIGGFKTEHRGLIDVKVSFIKSHRLSVIDTF